MQKGSPLFVGSQKSREPRRECASGACFRKAKGNQWDPSKKHEVTNSMLLGNRPPKHEGSLEMQTETTVFLLYGGDFGGTHTPIPPPPRLTDRAGNVMFLGNCPSKLEGFHGMRKHKGFTNGNPLTSQGIPSRNTQHSFFVCQGEPQKTSLQTRRIPRKS